MRQNNPYALIEKVLGVKQVRKGQAAMRHIWQGVWCNWKRKLQGKIFQSMSAIAAAWWWWAM